MNDKLNSRITIRVEDRILEAIREMPSRDRQNLVWELRTFIEDKIKATAQNIPDDTRT